MDHENEPSGLKSTGPDTAVHASAVVRARMAAVGQASRGVRGAGTRKDPVASEKAESTTGRLRRLAPFFAFLAVGGLGLVVALPAYAEFDSTPPKNVISGGIDGQWVAADGAHVDISRDAVSATQFTLHAQSANQLHVPVTYTNDPNGVIQWPFAVFIPISDMFGERPAPCSGCSTTHYGTDFDADEGYPIQAIADGVVTAVNLDPNTGDGLYINIAHNVKGMSFISRYCHLEEDSIMVAEGQRVSVTQVIALVGSTGAATGSHLHFELHENGVPVDPFAWLTEHAG